MFQSKRKEQGLGNTARQQSRLLACITHDFTLCHDASLQVGICEMHGFDEHTVIVLEGHMQTGLLAG